MSIDIKKSYWLFFKIRRFTKKLLAESDIIILKKESRSSSFYPIKTYLYTFNIHRYTY